MFIFHTAVTVNEGQGHSNWYQTVRFSGFFHLAKFKKKRFANVLMQVSVQCLVCLLVCLFVRNRLILMLCLEH